MYYRRFRGVIQTFPSCIPPSKNLQDWVEDMLGMFYQSRTFWKIIEIFLYRIIVRKSRALYCCFSLRGVVFV